MDLTRIARRSGLTALVAAGLFVTAYGASASTLNLPDAPLFLSQSSPPLNMLVVGRDHKLYYEAYNDASDLNGDGDIESGYLPGEIDYFGYFDSYVCYTYANDVWSPSSVNPSSGAGRTKKCPGDAWSGDFLNYLTTSRIDALRKVLYGGSRVVDDAGRTVLSRALIPQDAHSWGKEYAGLADGYDISEYSSLPLPNSGTRHHLASVTLLNDTSQLPLLRIRTNQSTRIWQWASTERPVLAGTANLTYAVRVEACVAGKISAAETANCRVYPSGSAKPVGLLQKYGENDAMMFGLITGSYGRNTEGGVLRKNVGSIRDEIDANTGQFTSVTGVIRTMDRLRVTGFGGSYEHNSNCGWITTRAISAGECRMWGNPIGEMMYEAVRYFADRGAPTPAFVNGAVGTDDATLGLPAPTWNRPYATASRCSKPFATVVSDINPSFDTNLMPGSTFGGLSTDVPGLNAATATDTISAAEGVNGTSRFIGQSGSTYDGAPTAKTVASLSSVRGLAPEEPTKQGGYLSAGVAYWANSNDVNASVAGRQQMQTFAVALASPLPQIDIPFPNGRRVTLVPFAKSVGGFSIDPTQGRFQPTNTIVDFYYDRANSSPPDRYSFRVNFEDVEQGADHDMDAIVEYVVEREGDDRVRVRLNSTYAAGSIIQHIGYVISGTTADGIYLEVRDNEPSDVRYFLNTPQGEWAGSANWQGRALGLTADRTFTVGATNGATLLKDPLWYAAKWGGFVDSNNNRRPDVESEWNQDGDAAGTPDNYFLVTNALRLTQQLSQAFDTILARASSASSVALNSGSLSDNSRVYQAKFNSDGWVGQLLSFRVTPDGAVPAEPEWDAAQLVPAANSRRIVTRRTDGTGIPFRWDSLDAPMKALLQPGGATDTLGDERLDYLRGSAALEKRSGGTFRDRATRLGDIVSSSPVFVGPPRSVYRDDLESVPYSRFRAEQRERIPMVYAGANDGMLHGFHAGSAADGGGVERIAYVPRAVYRNLPLLTRQDYTHRFYVDGTPTAVDAFVDDAWRTVLVGGLGRGGQAVYALDVTDPASFSENAADDVVMWEFDDRVEADEPAGSGDRDLGYTYARPSVTKLRNGSWVAIFGNGYNSTEADGSASTTGNAVLYIVDLATGRLLRKLDTGAGTAQDPTGLGRANGLSSPAAVDLDGDNVSEYVYAGDLHGNLWKFDLTSANPASWQVAYTTAGAPAPLYRARNDANEPQPIVSKPAVGRGPRGVGMLVLFGTGKYLEPSDRDVATLKVQSFYGLYDRNSGQDSDRITGRTQLVEQEIVGQSTVTFDNRPLVVRTTSGRAVGGSARGWYVDLVAQGGAFDGEMQVSDPILRAGRVLFTTLIPSPDPCEAGGTGWFMALDALSGARAARPQFDLNEDRAFDDGDMADGSVVSGVRSGMGFIQRPGLLSDNPANRDLVIASGSQGGNPCGPQGPRSGAGDDAGCSALSTQFGPFERGRQSWRQLR
jgi:type IV pilus assembly protein PilY1